MARFNFQKALIESIESVQHMTETHRIILEGSVDVIIEGDRLKIEQVINTF